MPAGPGAAPAVWSGVSLATPHHRTGYTSAGGGAFLVGTAAARAGHRVTGCHVKTAPGDGRPLESGDAARSAAAGFP